VLLLNNSQQSVGYGGAYRIIHREVNIGKLRNAQSAVVKAEYGLWLWIRAGDKAQEREQK
jgi:hypothetical protein